VLVEEIGSGGRERWQREALMRAARRRDIDAIVVWRLDRWGRSLADLVGTLHELQALGVGFISLSEALDFTTPAGRAMAGLLAIFAEFEREILRERVKARLSSKRPVGGLGLWLDVFHGLPVTSWAVNLRHAAPIRTTKLGRTNHHINNRFIDQHLFTTDPTAVEIFFWRGPKGNVNALSGWGLMRVLSHTSLF
jgi:Resolvase, N terminal domain